LRFEQRHTSGRSQLTPRRLGNAATSQKGVKRGLAGDRRHRAVRIVVFITSGLGFAPNLLRVWYAREEAVTDSVNINASWSQRTGLTPNAIFQLWKAALKDDENLLDELIASTYQQMMSLDQPRAERVMGLIIRRNRDAKEALKAMLNDHSRYVDRHA
jgi:hypothetical protein